MPPYVENLHGASLFVPGLYSISCYYYLDLSKPALPNPYAV